MQVPYCHPAPRPAAAEAPSLPQTVCCSALWSPAAAEPCSPGEQHKGKSVQIVQTDDNKAIRKGSACFHKRLNF